MSNEVTFLVVGNKYRIITDPGITLPFAMEAQYLGFQVQGGTTIFGFHYLGADKQLKTYLLHSDRLYAVEILHETAVQEFTPQVTGATEETKAPDADVATSSEEEAEGSEEEPQVQPAGPNQLDGPPKRGPGRPRKLVLLADGTMGPRPVGRPPKTPKEPVALDADGNPIRPRRGRPPKAITLMPHQGVGSTATPPTPAFVEEVDEIEERTPTTDAPVSVTAQTPPSPVAVVTSSAPVKTAVLTIQADDDEDEVVPVQRIVAKPQPVTTTVDL